MPLKRQQRGRPATARPKRFALTCALVVVGVLIPAAPAAAGPVLVTAPTVDRTGRTLTTDDGSWLLPVSTYEYGWERCNDATGVTCTTVPGQTAKTYLLTTADIGRYIRSVVTATDGFGRETARSSTTGVIAAAPPLNTTPPSVSGGGSTLTSTLGTWSDPSPGSVVYLRQWQQCTATDGLNCQDVPGQAGVTYTLTRADEGKFIRVVVSAEGLGAAYRESEPVGPILPGSGGTGGSNGNGNPAPTLRKLRPFPKVIIAGRLARGLTFVSGLAIRRGPKGSNVAVTCRGRGCPKGGRFRGKLNSGGGLQLKRFQRIYGPGAIIEIRITKRGAIGKFTRLTVRRRSFPSRRYACLMPGTSKPRHCP